LIYKKVLENKILQIFPEDNLDEDKIKECTLLLNFIYETLRLFPPVPILPARVTSEDCVLEGWFIPKGTTLHINVWSNQYNKDIWGEDVEKFNPDRFNNLSPIQKKSFLPFAAGQRVCLGRDLAVLELKIFLIKFFKKYEVTWAGVDKEVEQNHGFLHTNSKFKLNFKPIS
jgi:cytochrome P450